MFASLFLWFALVLYAERPMCTPTPDGQPCPYYPPWG